MNILIVDDEEFVLDYLEYCINTMAFSVNKIFKASSVDEALSTLQEHIIPIIITDISMPEKSGLDLLKALKEVRYRTKVIILSGHSEFEFAKTALQHGAIDYLLKPIVKEELEEVLQKGIMETLQEDEKKQELMKAKSDSRIALTKMREHLLVELFHGKAYSLASLREQMNSLGLGIEMDEESVIATFQLEKSDVDLRSHEETIEVFKSTVVNVAEELFYGDISEQSSTWFCNDQYHSLNILLPTRVVQKNFDHVFDKLNQLKYFIINDMRMNISILVTRPFPFNIQNLHSNYLNIVNYSLQNYRDMKCDIQIVDNESIQAASTTLSKFNETPTILSLLEGKRWSEVTSKMEAVLDESGKNGCFSHNQLMEVVYYLYSCFSYMSYKLGQELPIDSDRGTFVRNPYSIKSTEQIKIWAQTCITNLSQIENEKDQNQDHSFLIRQINTFINENLNKDVSLQKLADHVYLHPVYISRMYKKETGENISAYILHLRMERAVTLLTTTNKNIAEITLEVGYRKTQYFIQLFKENYRTTPQKYRNNFRNK